MKGLHIAMIVLWGIIGLSIVAVIVAGVAFNGNGFGFNFNFDAPFDSDMTLVVDETVSANSLDEIKIGLSSDECVVYFTDSDSINIKHYVYRVPEQGYARVTSSGSRLDISTKPMRSNLMFFGFISRRSLVEIYIPESYEDKLGVDLSSGTLMFDSGTRLSGLDIQITSGTLTFNSGMELSDLNIRLSSGDIRAKELIKTNNAVITVTSGTTRLTGGLETEKYSLKVSSGDINIGEMLTGSGSVDVTSGTIRLSGVDIADSLNVGVSSGDIYVELAGNPSLNFTGRKSSGDIHTYFNALHDDRGNYSATVGEGPYKNLDVRVTSGTIRVTSAS